MSTRDPDRERRWRGLITQWKQSGQTARAFCHDRELNVHTLYGWHRELRRRDGGSKSSGKKNQGHRFVQVEVTGPSWLELSLGGDLVLRVPSSVTADRLTEILAAARKAC